MLLSIYQWVSAMTYKMYATFIASLSVVALVFGASETFADPGVAHAGGLAPQRPAFQPSAKRAITVSALAWVNMCTTHPQAGQFQRIAWPLLVASF